MSKTPHHVKLDNTLCNSSAIFDRMNPALSGIDPLVQILDFAFNINLSFPKIQNQPHRFSRCNKVIH